MPATLNVVSSIGRNRELRRVSGWFGGTMETNSAIVVSVGKFATSRSVPVFTGHLSVPHANAAEPDTSNTTAPHIALRIFSRRVRLRWIRLYQKRESELCGFSDRKSVDEIVVTLLAPVTRRMSV